MPNLASRFRIESCQSVSELPAIPFRIPIGFSHSLVDSLSNLVDSLSNLVESLLHLVQPAPNSNSTQRVGFDLWSLASKSAFDRRASLDRPSTPMSTSPVHCTALVISGRFDVYIAPPHNGLQQNPALVLIHPDCSFLSPQSIITHFEEEACFQ
jgi:hypothetical protein